MLKNLTLALALTLAGTALHAEPTEKDNIHMFPQAQEGFVRHVIEVPKTDNDYDHKVELLIGKTMMVDCNHHSFYGKIEDITLKGWGYKYLEVKEIKSGATTMMACSEPKTEQYISIRDSLRRYNSRSPIVVYVPKGYEVKYRVWSASETVEDAVER